MKIQFTNDTRTEAIVTRGWFRKKQARLYFDKDSWRWYFAVNRKYVGDWINLAVRGSKEDSERIDPWQPVVELPKAKALKAP